MMVRLTFSVMVVLAVLATGVFAETGATTLGLTTERVIVFKDGYCMFVKQATGRTNAAAQTFIDDIPDTMTLGSFWAVPKTGKLKSIVASQRIIPKQGEQETQKTLALEFDSASANRRVELTLIYFGPGIRWIPTYRIAIGSDDMADMMMQAEILNEAEDMSGVAAGLVVGVPNFRFKNVVSPLSLEANLRNPLQSAAPQIMSQTMSNVLMSQQMVDMRAMVPESGGPGSSTVPALPAELSSQGSQDLFVYNVPKLTLDSGQRAAIPLISTTVPFRHIYTWDVHLSRSGSEAVPGRGKHAAPIKLLKNEVWHQIELTNNTDSPWTTGAALIMDGYLPVAQELLTYTSIGAKCQVPLTVAVDIRGTYEEEETSRDLKALRFDGNDYVRISKKGTLKVTNHKKEKADLLISCEFGGNATKASDGGKIKLSDFHSEDWRDFRGSRALSGHSAVKWELTLAPGATKEVTCEYHYFTR